MHSARQHTIQLSAEETARLTRLLAPQACSRRVARRARMILLAADGLSNHEIAAVVGVNHQTVRIWRRRFAQGRIPSLYDRSARRSATVETPIPGLPPGLAAPIAPMPPR